MCGTKHNEACVFVPFWSDCQRAILCSPFYIYWWQIDWNWNAIRGWCLKSPFDNSWQLTSTKVNSIGSFVWKCVYINELRTANCRWFIYLFFPSFCCCWNKALYWISCQFGIDFEKIFTFSVCVFKFGCFERDRNHSIESEQFRIFSNHLWFALITEQKKKTRGIRKEASLLSLRCTYANIYSNSSQFHFVALFKKLLLFESHLDLYSRGSYRRSLLLPQRSKSKKRNINKSNMVEFGILNLRKKGELKRILNLFEFDEFKMNSNGKKTCRWIEELIRYWQETHKKSTLAVHTH